MNRIFRCFKALLRLNALQEQTIIGFPGDERMNAERKGIRARKPPRTTNALATSRRDSFAVANHSLRLRSHVAAETIGSVQLLLEGSRRVLSLFTKSATHSPR